MRALVPLSLYANLKELFSDTHTYASILRLPCHFGGVRISDKHEYLLGEVRLVECSEGIKMTSSRGGTALQDQSFTRFVQLVDFTNLCYRDFLRRKVSWLRYAILIDDVSAEISQKITVLIVVEVVRLTTIAQFLLS